MQMWRNRLPLGEGPARETRPDVVIRPIPTVILGAVAGLLVGLTSVGAGSIVVVVLLLLYPRLKASSLVGTDLTQAIPLVAAAALGHILFGSFSLAIAFSLLVGAIPGAWIGAQISSRAPGGVIRRALAILLLASGLKLLGVPDTVVAVARARGGRVRVRRVAAHPGPRAADPADRARRVPASGPRAVRGAAGRGAPGERTHRSMTAPLADGDRAEPTGLPRVVLDEDGLDRLELVLGGWLPASAIAGGPDTILADRENTPLARLRVDARGTTTIEPLAELTRGAGPHWDPAVRLDAAAVRERLDGAVPDAVHALVVDEVPTRRMTAMAVASDRRRGAPRRRRRAATGAPTGGRGQLGGPHPGGVGRWPTSSTRRAPGAPCSGS